MENYGERIRKLRQKIGMSQTELALILGYSDKSGIARVETGRNRISTAKLLDYAKALNTTIEYLLYGDNDHYNSVILMTNDGKKESYDISTEEMDKVKALLLSFKEVKR